MLRPYSCDCSDVYIVVKGTIDLLAAAAASAATDENDKTQKNESFKNNAPFISHISKLNNIIIENAEDLNIVITMYNLSEYRQNYSMTSGSFWNYYRDEFDGVYNNASDGNSFEYKKNIRKNTRKTKKIGNEEDTDQPPQPAVPVLNVEVTILLKHLRDFWRFPDLPLTNCETEFHLSWAKDCVLMQNYDNVTGTNFMITSTKLYVPVVTLPINDNIKFLENIKQGFKRTISWNKYRFETTMQPKNNNLDYFIDPTFRNTNRLFVLSFKNDDNDPTKDSKILMH